jgi:hypothetical protein
MALLECHECGKDVSTEAKQCINCGAKVRKPSIQVSSAVGWKTIVAACFIIPIIIWFSIQGNMQAPQPSASIAPTSIEACVSAEELIKLLLQSPATAKFPFCGDQRVVNVGNNKWQISSYVDSENGFSALLRMNYTALLEDDGKNASLIYLKNDDTGEILWGAIPAPNVPTSDEQNQQYTIPQVEQSNNDPLTVSGIIGGEKATAVIGGKFYKQGGLVNGYKIIQIGSNYVEYVDKNGHVLHRKIGQ